MTVQAQSTRPCLELLKPKAQAGRIDLVRGHYEIGRGDDVAIRIDADNTISRVHAVLVERDGLFYLIAKGKHGTWVNRKKLAPETEARLEDGDSIKLAKKVRLKFHASTPEARSGESAQRQESSGKATARPKMNRTVLVLIGMSWLLLLVAMVLKASGTFDGGAEHDRATIPAVLDGFDETGALRPGADADTAAGSVISDLAALPLESRKMILRELNNFEINSRKANLDETAQNLAELQAKVPANSANLARFILDLSNSLAE